jgi:hypothetical protein
LPYIRIKDNPINERDGSLLYIASNCKKHRELFFKEYRKLDKKSAALGQCSNTQGGRLLQQGYRGHGAWEELADYYAKYKFGMAMENRKIPYYVTEKILNVFESGAIPIYWGDSVLAKKLFNEKAFIDISDFNSVADAAKYVYELSKDPKRLQDMANEPVFKDNTVPEIFKWKSENIPQIIDAATYLRNKYFERTKFISLEK